MRPCGHEREGGAGSVELERVRGGAAEREACATRLPRCDDDHADLEALSGFGSRAVDPEADLLRRPRGDDDGSGIALQRLVGTLVGTGRPGALLEDLERDRFTALQSRGEAVARCPGDVVGGVDKVEVAPEIGDGGAEHPCDELGDKHPFTGELAQVQVALHRARVVAVRGPGGREAECALHGEDVRGAGRHVDRGLQGRHELADAPDGLLLQVGLHGHVRGGEVACRGWGRRVATHPTAVGKQKKQKNKLATSHGSSLASVGQRIYCTSMEYIR